MNTDDSTCHDYVKRILSAKIYDLVKQTPVTFAKALSKRTNNQVWIKREDLQPVFSFKLRGAYNCLLNLSKAQANKGVIAASAGNHAQGLAMAAQHLGIAAYIVMPITTPAIKVDAVRSFGAEVVLKGDSFPEALAHSMELQKSKGLTYIHPFNNEDVIAGQGTVAMELMHQVANLDAVFIPVGGGGLISGMAIFIKYLNPNIKIIGVEPEDAASLTYAIAKGKPVALKEIGLFADGVAVAQVGDKTFAIAGDKRYVDQVVTVTTDEICAAIKDLYDDTRAITEPAGACALAGLKKYVADAKISGQEEVTGLILVALASGANINFDRLRHVAERAEIGEQREAIIAAEISEKPGSFRAFCQAIGDRNITEFNYRYADAKTAQVFAGIQIDTDKEDRQELFTMLENNGIPALDLSDNEMAKVHIRYMVGGHAQVDDEVIYRFIFPERPRALMNFLELVGNEWNISMFHYRNHGSAYGRVLIGMQVPAHKTERFNDFLKKLDYDHYEETHNQAYQLFLSSAPKQ